jgi:hypothetical protein
VHRQSVHSSVVTNVIADVRHAFPLILHNMVRQNDLNTLTKAYQPSHEITSRFGECKQRNKVIEERNIIAHDSINGSYVASITRDSTEMQGFCVLRDDRDLYQGIFAIVRHAIGREAVHTAQMVTPRLPSANMRMDVRLDALTRATVEELAPIGNRSPAPVLRHVLHGRVRRGDAAPVDETPPSLGRHLCITGGDTGAMREQRPA